MSGDRPPQWPAFGSRRLRRFCTQVLRIGDRVAARVLVAGVVAYKFTLSPLLGRHCRFEPTCSVYFRRAVERYGAIRGTARGIARICRCHPWHPGGYDPP